MKKKPVKKTELITKDTAAQIGAAATSELSLDDVLAIVTHRAEQQYRQDILSSQESLKKLEADLSTIIEKQNEAIQKLANTKMKTTKNAYDTVVALSTNNHKYNTVITANMSGDTITVICKLVDCAGGVIANRLPSTVKTIATPATIKKMTRSAEQLQKKIDNQTELVIECKRRLNNISQVEKLYRACIAEHKLSESVKGQKILDIINDDFNTMIYKISV